MLNYAIEHSFYIVGSDIQEVNFKYKVNENIERNWYKYYSDTFGISVVNLSKIADKISDDFLNSDKLKSDEQHIQIINIAKNLFEKCIESKTDNFIEKKQFIKLFLLRIKYIGDKGRCTDALFLNKNKYTECLQITGDENAYFTGLINGASTIFSTSSKFVFYFAPYMNYDNEMLKNEPNFKFKLLEYLKPTEIKLNKQKNKPIEIVEEYINPFSRTEKDLSNAWDDIIELNTKIDELIIGFEKAINNPNKYYRSSDNQYKSCKFGLIKKENQDEKIQKLIKKLKLIEKKELMDDYKRKADEEYKKYIIPESETQRGGVNGQGEYENVSILGKRPQEERLEYEQKRMRGSDSYKINQVNIMKQFGKIIERNNTSFNSLIKGNNYSINVDEINTAENLCIAVLMSNIYNSFKNYKPYIEIKDVITELSNINYEDSFDKVINMRNYYSSIIQKFVDIEYIQDDNLYDYIFGLYEISIEEYIFAPKLLEETLQKFYFLSFLIDNLENIVDNNLIEFDHLYEEFHNIYSKKYIGTEH